MNSLAYLSRQFNVLASQNALATGQDDELDDRRGRDAVPQHLNRNRSFVRSSARRDSSSTSPGKRSASSPSLFALHRPKRTPPPFEPAEPTPVASSDEPARRVLQRWRSAVLARAWTLLWNALAAAWRLLTRRRIEHALPARGDDSSADEKDSEEDDPLVHRAKPGVAFALPADDRPTDDAALPPLRVPLPSVNLTPSTPSAPPLPPAKGTLLPNPLAHYLLSSYSPPPSLPPTPPTQPAQSARKTAFHLPKTLVLDLDETLIHSTSRPLYGGAASAGTGLLGLGGFGRRGKTGGHTVEVVLGGRSTLYHVYKRPFADYFLRKVAEWYTLVIFTASMQEYADPVIDWLDGGRGILSRRLFRESCTQLPSGSYTKDLSIVEADLARVCLVDNSPVSYSINQANGIPIEGWTHDLADEALLDLLPFLDSLRFTGDVRRVLGIRGFT